MLCRTLLERLDKTVSTALIFNSYLTKMELLQAITDDFGLQPHETTSKGYIDVLNEYLLGEFAAGRNAVVVIDEAQNLEPTVLEQLRMLSNLETERQAAPDYSRRAARAACEAGDAPDASTRTAHCGALLYS